MRKLVAAINMTLDGFCDHTAVIADDALHQHYTELLSNAGTLLYGRITYELMQYWQAVLKNPTGNKAMDEFAVVIDRIPKIVFSHTLKDPGWETATLAGRGLEDEVQALRAQEGKDILAGSPGLIISLLKLNLLDEFQLCVHPVVAGKGLPLFKNIDQEINLTLIKTKTFSSGAVVFYYALAKK